jgi:hypothetical protein
MEKDVAHTTKGEKTEEKKVIDRNSAIERYIRDGYYMIQRVFDKKIPGTNAMKQKTVTLHLAVRAILIMRANYAILGDILVGEDLASKIKPESTLNDLLMLQLIDELLEQSKDVSQ